jgi:hypothetical protein
MIDLSTSITWSDVTNTTVPAPGALSDWDGQTNTTAIVAQSITTSAADLCNDYTNVDYGSGIYSDWYLPTIHQLNKLWDGIYEVNKALESDGNGSTTAFGKKTYWSSTEFNLGTAYYFYFDDGHSYGNYKNSLAFVRAVRSF